MGKHFSLTAADQHRLGAYRADPTGDAKGGMVVIQEIFGVNHHIRAVCDRLAREGYAAVAPALFDRTERDFECGYSEAEMAKAFTFIANPDFEAMLRDTQAAIDELGRASPVGIMGFCMGGTVAFAASAKCRGLSAAVCYYGGFIAKMADEKPKCPVQMHFGETDSYIPMSDVEMIRSKAAAGRNLRLCGRRPRLPLRRAGKLPRPERQARLAALDGVSAEAHEGLVQSTSARTSAR